MKKPELPPAPSRSTSPSVAPSAAQPTPTAPARAQKPPKPPKSEPPPDVDLLCGPQPPTEPIIGSGDRAHHLALVAGTGTFTLRQPTRPTTTLPPLRPTSRAACERRCGRAGQCDPASPFGCGGEYCRGLEGRLY